MDWAGFTAIDVKPFLYRLEFASEEDIIGFWQAAALVPILTALPSELHERFLDAFRETYFALFGANPRIVEQKRLFISAKK